jgi:hypothetical protein
MLERWSARIDWEKLLNRRSISWRKIPEVDRNDMDRDRAFLAVGFSEIRFAEFWANAQ